MELAVRDDFTVRIVTLPRAPIRPTIRLRSRSVSQHRSAIRCIVFGSSMRARRDRQAAFASIRAFLTSLPDSPSSSTRFASRPIFSTCRRRPRLARARARQRPHCRRRLATAPRRRSAARALARSPEWPRTRRFAPSSRTSPGAFRRRAAPPRARVPPGAGERRRRADLAPRRALRDGRDRQPSPRRPRSSSSCGCACAVSGASSRGSEGERTRELQEEL